jgi:hypothetical protein
MPMGIPQSLMYSYRGAGADGNSVRDRSTEQAPTYSGNPNMPVFNQPSPNGYPQRNMPVDPSQMNPTQDPGTGYNGIDSLGNSLGGSVNGGRIRPNPNVMLAMRRFRGMNSGMPQRPSTGIPQNNIGTMGAQPPAMPMWQGHQVTPDQYAQIQSTNARTAALRSTWGQTQNPPPQPVLPATY